MKKEIEEKIGEIWCKSYRDFKSMKKKKRKKIDKKDRPYRRIKHCKKVFKITKIITDRIDINNKCKKELKIAAWLHDIKKYKHNHANKGAKYIAENLHLENLDVNNICEIVKYHSLPKWDENDLLEDNESEITDEINKSIFIIRVADKLSKEKNKTPKKIKKIVTKVYENSIDDIVSIEEKVEIEDILIGYYV